MSAAFDEIAKLLHSLTADELAEVRARAGILLQSGGRPAASAPTTTAAKIAAPPAESADLDIIVQEIAAYFQREGLEYVSEAMLKRTANYRSFEAKAIASLPYFRKVSSQRVRLRAIIRLAIRLLHKDMQAMNVAVSVRTLMNHWHRVPAVIDKNFPGYAKIGMLRLLIGEAGEAEPRYVQETPERSSE
jgi:hypothetical protein